MLIGSKSGSSLPVSHDTSQSWHHFLSFIIWAEAWQHQQNDLCIQQILSSDWPSAQADHFFTVHFKYSQGQKASSFGQLRLDRLDRLIQVFAGYTVFVGFVMLWHFSFHMIVNLSMWCSLSLLCFWECLVHVNAWFFHYSCMFCRLL